MIDESLDARSSSPGADIWFVAVAASAVGLKALTALLSALPSDFSAAVAIVQHRVPEKETHLQSLLSRHATLPVTMASNGLAIEGGNVYLASSESHLIAQDPATAEFTGMPDATIRTGLTNYISPLSSIARILVSIVSGTRSPAEVA